LNFFADEGLAQIEPIFKEADDSSFNINQYADDGSDFKVTELRLTMSIQLVIVFPFSICELVSSCQIYAPHVLLPA
jgi:hypothetical protein